jgi:hypothetical protein
MILIVSLAGCTRPDPPGQRAAAAPTVARSVERGAAGDRDLRVMLAEVASARACELMRGQFRALRAVDRPGVVTGALWIRDCKITNTGTDVAFALSGNGWQWAAQQQHKAGGTFAIKQYVKFAMTATIRGALDIAYQPGDHVVSLWFTPSQPPEVTFTPVGAIDVDTQGAWSSVVGAIGSVFASSPEHQAREQAKDQGGHELEHQLADGLSVTVNLCTGLTRFALGREPKGKMSKPDAGETQRVSIELSPDAVMVFGPQLVGDAGYTANVDATTGTVLAQLVCRDQAEAVAAAYVEGRPLPVIHVLAEKAIHGKASLRVARASCQVTLIARPLVASVGGVTFDWERPATERARSTGGPLISCNAARQ